MKFLTVFSLFGFIASSISLRVSHDAKNKTKGIFDDASIFDGSLDLLFGDDYQRRSFQAQARRENPELRAPPPAATQPASRPTGWNQPVPSPFSGQPQEEQGSQNGYEDQGEEEGQDQEEESGSQGQDEQEGEQQEQEEGQEEEQDPQFNPLAANGTVPTAGYTSYPPPSQNQPNGQQQEQEQEQEQEQSGQQKQEGQEEQEEQQSQDSSSDSESESENEEQDGQQEQQQENDEQQQQQQQVQPQALPYAQPQIVQPQIQPQPRQLTVEM